MKMVNITGIINQSKKQLMVKKNYKRLNKGRVESKKESISYVINNTTLE